MSGKIVHRSMVAQFEAGLERKLAGGVLQALIIGAREASVLTPIDTSTLLNSQFRNVGKRAGRIVGTVGYTAEYALAVHDPDNRQNFRRDSAEKEFLTKGFERAEPEIRAVLAAALKP